MRDVLRDPIVTRRTAAWAALFLDESGEGFAEYTVVLGFFAVQCVCGALALNHKIDDIVHTIRAVL